MTLVPGTFRAKATAAELGFTEGGKEQLAVSFQVTEGEYAGEAITAYLFFTEKTEKRTIESLRHCGWTGNDLENLMGEGLGSKECEIVLGNEEYNGETKLKVRWINAIGGGVALRNKMSEDQRRAFAARMRDRAAAVQAAAGSGVSGDDLPFLPRRRGAAGCNPRVPSLVRQQGPGLSCSSWRDSSVGRASV